MTNARIPALDGLRGIAILLVFAGHAALFGPGTAGAGKLRLFLAHNNGTGVDLFFVLSGFLITGILLDLKGQDGYFRSFYLRRTLRIFPLYYATLVGVSLMKIAFPDAFALASVTTTAQVANFTYTNNFLIAARGWGSQPAFLAHFWSLGVEEQFYMLWPVIVFAATRVTLRQLVVGGVVGALIIRLVLLNFVSFESAYVLLPARMDGLLIGAWISITSRDAPRKLLPRIPAVLIVTIFAADLVAGELSLEGTWRMLRTAAHFSIGSFAFGVMVLWATSGERMGAFVRFLSSPVLRFFGKYSYAIYVFHIGCIVYLAPALIRVGGAWVTHSPFMYALFALGFTSILALLSWQLLEHPFLKLRDVLSNRA